MFDLREEVVAPIMVFAVPIVAIAGGIIAGVIRTLSQHRLMETALRERMALVARGIDPERLGRSPYLPPLLALEDYGRIRAQGLLIGGFVTLAGGAAFMLVAGSLDSWETGDWSLGVVAVAAGLALLVSGLLVWPRGGARTAAHPR